MPHDVTQADREAAKRYYSGAFLCEAVLSEAFAAHRLAAIAEERARVVECLRITGDCYNQNNARTSPRCDRCPGCGRYNAADAIERGDHVQEK